MSACRLRNFAPYIVLTVLWLGAYSHTRHLASADGTSYVAVAELWVSGRWADAVNGYWGPLLSWLMAPLIILGIPALYAMRLVLLGGALLCLPSLRALTLRAGASRRSTDVLLLATAPFLAYIALHYRSPDVLLAASLLRSCDLLFRPDFLTSKRVSVEAGAWGGVAYLAKAYGAPVVLVLIPAGVLVHCLSTRGLHLRPLLGQGLLAAAGFTLIFGAWAGVLSASYGEPTFSTSAGFNSRLIAPGSAGNPLEYPGLYPPVRSDALSVWVEPSQLVVPTRDGAGSPPKGAAGELSGRFDTALMNAKVIAGTVVLRGLPLALLALVGVASFVRHQRLPPPELVGPLVAGAINVGGLVLIIAVERYVWFAIVACAPAAAVGLDVLMKRQRRRQWLVVGTALTISMSGIALLAVSSSWNVDRDVTVAAQEMRLEAPVATVGRENWQRTLHLCLQVGCQYFGRPEARTSAAVAAELDAAGVEYLVVWPNGDDKPIHDLRGSDRSSVVVTVYSVSPQRLLIHDEVIEGTVT